MTSLTDAGRKRARLLSEILRDAQIAAVFTTEFRRTIETAQPTADRFRLAATRVPNADPVELRKRILAMKQKAVLVVGHSNTLPALIRALGGPEDVTIAETEFDNLFLLHVNTDQSAALVRLRYGGATNSALPAAQSGTIRFRRSGGITGREIAGTIVMGPENARVEGPGGYSRTLSAEAVSSLLASIQSEANRPRTPQRGADQYNYEIIIERTGQSITLADSAKGPLLDWVRQETAAIERALTGKR
jgi:phosphohistidine phosphatase SixA